MAAVAAAAAVARASAQTVPVIGETYAHDPSPIVNQNGTDFYYSTGQGILARESTDLSHWSDGPAIFSTNPAWTTADVPGFTGDYWAPQVNYFNSQYHLYYAVSTFGSQVSGIGMATSPTLNPSASNYGWTDQGPVILSAAGGSYNTIDPSVITAQDGTMWMSFGSYWQGIYEIQLNPATGLRLNPSVAPTHLSIHLDAGQDNEASYLYFHSGYYYLFENWGSCCSGTASTYNVRIGRSTSVNGPFVDQAGVSLLNGGGSLFLGGTGNYIGPGQVGIYSQGGSDYLSYHYYNGANNGTPALGIQTLHWASTGWPSVNDTLTWSASTSGSASDGGGTWNLASTHFVGTAGPQSWDNTGYGAVTFGSAAGPAGVVNVAQPTAVQTITFNASSSGNYTLAGASAIALPVYATVTSNVAATIATPLTAGQLTTTGTGTLTLTGASTVTNLFVKQGALALAGNGSLTTATNPVSTNNNYSSIGQAPGDAGRVSLSGSSTLTVAGDLNVADVGAVGNATIGILNVGNSAIVNARTFFVGKYSAVTGTVNQTGGTVQEVDNGAAPGDWRLGGAGSASDVISVGVYNLSGGTLNPGRANFQVGAYGSGTVTQTGGTAIVGYGGGGYLSIGRFPGSTGVYDLSSGNGTLNETAGPPVMIVGEQGTGTLRVGGTSTINANGLSIGHNNGAIGTVIQTGGTIYLGAGGVQFGPSATATGGASAVGLFNLAGGTLVAPTIVQNTSAPVVGTVLFNGGTLRASAGGTLIPVGLSHAYISAGGAMVDTATNTTTVAAVLAHDPSMGTTVDGGLAKLGTGTLILSAVETYTGPTTVSAGSLQLGTAANELPIGSAVTVGLGGTLALNGANQSVASLSGPAGSAVNLGSGKLTFNTTGVSSFGGIISGTGTVVMNGAGTQILGGVDTYSGGTSVNNGTLNLGLNSKGIRTTGPIVVAAGASLVTGPVVAGRSLIVTPTLSIAGAAGHWTGSVDLAGNDLDLGGGTLAMVVDQLRQGYAQSGGAGWTGPGGIVSSAAATDARHLTALGVIGNSQTGAPIYNAANPFDSATPGAADVLVKYTWFGDANLDGRVDGSDFSLIDAGYSSGGRLTGWLNGDFNYDGVVDGSDYALIDNGFNNQTAPGIGGTAALVASTASQLAGATAVPEPAGLTAIALIAAAARRRRK